MAAICPGGDELKLDKSYQRMSNKQYVTCLLIA